MNKPASVAIKEFETNLETVINQSGLPPVIIEMVLRGCYIQIRELAKKQTESESAAYGEMKENEVPARRADEETKNERGEG